MNGVWICKLRERDPYMRTFGAIKWMPYGNMPRVTEQYNLYCGAVCVIGAAALSWKHGVYVSLQETCAATRKQTDVEGERLQQRQRFNKKMVFTSVPLTSAE